MPASIPKSSPNVRAAPDRFDRNCIGLERRGRRDADRRDRDGRAPQAVKFVGLGEDLGHCRGASNGPMNLAEVVIREVESHCSLYWEVSGLDDRPG